MYLQTSQNIEASNTDYNKHALITNIQLKKWGLKESEFCSFCEWQKETVIHLFCECTEVNKLWNCIPSIFEYVEKTPVNTSICAKLFNRIAMSKYHIYNVIALFLKQYVYRQRCLKKRLNVFEFKCFVRQIKNMELYYAQKKGKVSLHYKKWCLEKHLITNQNVFNPEQYLRMHIENAM